MLVATGGSGVNIPDLTLSGEFTIEGWINFEDGTVIDNQDGFLRNNTGNIHINFWEGQMRLASYTGSGPQGDVVIANTAVTTGVWNHFAITRDAAGILRVYTNGVLDGTATEAWNETLRVDRIAETLRGATEGAFDEMRFWDTARTEAEIAASRDVTIDPSTTGLVRYYRFDDQNQLIDETGNTGNVTPPAGVSLQASDSPVTTGNAAPAAVNDSAATPENTAAILSVLANDTDIDGSLVASTVTVVSGPTNGGAVENPDGTITYTPNQGYVGSDSFTYTVEDDDGAVSNAATVTLTVGTPNQAPVALDDNETTAVDTPIEISVLGNDSDADGTLDVSSVTVTTQPTGGSVQINPTGTVTYTPNGGFEGVDSFVYTVDDDDGATSNTATATVVVGSGDERALSSDGTSPLDVPKLKLNGAFTIEAWMYFAPGSGIGAEDSILIDTSQKVDLNFENGQFRFSSTKNGFAQGDLAVANTQVSEGTWNHFAITRDDSGTLRIYVNGVLEDTSSVTWTSSLVLRDLMRGTNGNTDATMDEFRIWTTERSQSEIAANMATPVTPTSPGLARYYSFDDPAQIVDETGNSASLSPAPGMTIVPSTSPVSTGNAAPIAGDDTASTPENTATVLSVLANDLDPDGSLVPGTVTVVSPPVGCETTVTVPGTRLPSGSRSLAST
ncbi:MAG: Ig-like domain-containing protein, partial [Pseudomonadota bacterium]